MLPSFLLNTKKKCQHILTKRDRYGILNEDLFWKTHHVPVLTFLTLPRWIKPSPSDTLLHTVWGSLALPYLILPALLKIPKTRSSTRTDISPWKLLEPRGGHCDPLGKCFEGKLRKIHCPSYWVLTSTSFMSRTYLRICFQYFRMYILVTHTWM